MVVHALQTRRQESRQNDARYRALFTSMPTAVFVCDRDAVIQDFNPRAAALWGREPARGVEKHCGSVRLWLPDGTWLPHDRSPMLEVLRSGIPLHDVEALIERPDGSRLPVLVNFAPLTDERGEIIGAITSFTDISELKQARAQIGEYDRRFRDMIDALPVAVYTTDAQGRVTHCNPAAAAGRTPLLGKDEWCVAWKLFQPDGTPLAHADCPMAQALRDGRAVHGTQIIAERPDGTRRWMEVYPSRLLNADGEVTGGINMLVDITERKALEFELRSNATQLADADRRKDEFVAILAHELRHPLPPIRHATQLLKQPGGSAESIQLAATMLERQVDHMVRLVDDLLDASRVSRGQIQLRRGRIELSSAVHHAVEAAQPLYARMQRKLSVTLPSAPLYVEGDPVRLAQVIGNLLHNACKFSELGGVVGLHATREDDQAVIRVHDTGIGLSAEQRPRIFDLFTQIDTSLERSVGGLGIGLTLVKHLVALHAGTVEVRSPGLGQGCEFVVRLPLLEETAAAASLPPPRAAPGSVVPRRILVVDDNRDAAISLAMLLRLDGHEVHLSHDGKAAVEAAANLRPDLMLLDIGLPKLNGYEVCRQVRTQPWSAGMTLVALTGWGQEEDRRKSTAAGFNGHMVKPVDLDSLSILLASLPPL